MAEVINWYDCVGRHVYRCEDPGRVWDNRSETIGDVGCMDSNTLLRHVLALHGLVLEALLRERPVYYDQVLPPTSSPA